MNSTTEKFDKDIEYGKTGEEIAYKFFRSLLKDGKPVVNHITDVRNVPQFQTLDVDFIIDFMDGKVSLVEVKTDRQAYKTGNLVFETRSNGNPGCLLRSIADVVAYVVPETNSLYYLSLERIKMFIQSTPTLVERDMGDGARGYLIDIKSLLSHNVGQERKIK